MNNQKDEKAGRGWHGDSAGHAEAGRKGGKARAEKRKKNLAKKEKKN